jgi:uncharacterized delta-60 repeat protein
MNKNLWLIILSFSGVYNSDAVVLGNHINNYAIAVQQNGQPVVTGTVDLDESNDLFALRLTQEGGLDDTFSLDGVVNLNQSSTSYDLAISTTNNTITLAGDIVEGSNRSVLLVRYLSDGSLDSSFGDSGLVTTTTGESSIVRGIILQPDEKIIAAGNVIIDGSRYGLLIRYNEDGSVDTGFGENGSSILLIDNKTEWNAVALQANGNIVVTGSSRNAVTGVNSFVTARYDSSGALDTSFGTNGVVTTGSGTLAYSQDVHVQSDNKVVVGGYDESNGLIIRYDTDGSLDLAFGVDGIITVDLGDKTGIHGLDISSTGTIMATGFYAQAENTIGFIAQYDTTGTLLTSFGDNGIVRELAATTTKLLDVSFTTNSGVIVTGTAGDDGLIVKYMADGQRDTSFGINGVIYEPIATAFQTDRIAIISDEKTLGAPGGSFFAGDFVTRDLNTIRGNMNKVTLSSNRITIQPGVFEVRIQAPAYHVQNHQVVLYDVTNDQIALEGSNAFASVEVVTLLGSQFNGAETLSIVKGTLHVGAQTVFEVRHQCSQTQEDNGFGVVSNIGENEVYTIVRIIRRVT